MKRELCFNKYRNLGFYKEEKIILNNCLEKGKMGNLVIVVGANNSGKSNVLDGLNEINNRKLNQLDITTLSFEEADLNPSLTLKADKYKYSITEKGEHIEGENFSEQFENERAKNISKIKDAANLFVQAMNNHGNSYYVRNYATELLEALDNEKTPINVKIEKIKEFIHHVKSDIGYASYGIDDLRKKYFNECELFLKLYDNDDYTIINNFNCKDVINKSFNNQYGIDLVPNILKYTSNDITNNDINCSISEIRNNHFLSTVFNKIEVSMDEVVNAYSLSQKQNNRGPLLEMEHKLNGKLSSISDDFNDLYFSENDKYGFEFRLESTSIAFIILRGSKSISLNQQSTGFRWFFNLYFNLLCNNKLNTGDIIIMDEPATNLHVQGQMELRKFLKDFAVKNDIVIIIATHSPFLIDIDYLDEIRVISMNDNVSKIINDFTAMDIDDPDTLKPIKQALTVHNNILISNEDARVIFVEGITDYNYLLAFKKLFKIENIVFLPIKGVGNIKEKGYKENQQRISKELLKLRKHDAMLLVDGDGAGKSIQNVNKESDLDVFSLSDIDNSFKEIETLFDPVDLEKLNLIDENKKYIKHSCTSALVKTYVNEYEFSDATINNFKKVFDFLLNA